jgi:type II restriction/modification system DNA methylase subunit YeeA
MPVTISAQEFVNKCADIQLKETAAAQSYFNDICRLVGYPTPVEYDSTGKDFSFETTTVQPGGQKGFADVYFRDHFNWEYKGAHKDLPPIPLSVSPEQLYDIEINPYAHELAQITAWISYLQWCKENGFDLDADPVLELLHNIQRMDAILAYDAEGNPVEPQCPPADVIIGNPPFLGGNKIRQELGDKYVSDLFEIYDNRIPASADLVCYWFEKARSQIVNDKGQTAGLIATNSIRGGANRTVLDRIIHAGDIYIAWSDNPWILDGAAVRVSIVGFDDGSISYKKLDDNQVNKINSDLTSISDLTKAVPLAENTKISMRTDEKGGPFDIPNDLAQKMLKATNLTGKLNSDVVLPCVNSLDIVRRNRNMWIIDFGVDIPIEFASQYELPFKYVKENVKPMRADNRVERLREKWWIHRIPGKEMRETLKTLRRFIVTPSVAKHRIFAWLNFPTMPDHQLYAFARDDDYFFGVLHSRPHDLWALRLGTWLGKGNGPRYTPTTTFETFPFPWPPGQEPSEEEDERVAAIAQAARELVAWREEWLNPPPPPSNVIDTTDKKRLKQRTLTNLYNGLVYFRESRQPGSLWSQAEFDKVTRKSVTRSEIQELDDIHQALDTAVFDANNWPHDLSDEDILERLLALNLERAADQETSEPSE